MIYLALRYLLERRRQTILTLLGVFFGTVAYVAVSGFFLGFQGFMVEQLVNNAAQVHIQARQDYVERHQLDHAFYGEEVINVFWDAPPAGTLGYLEVQNPQSWYARLNSDERVEAYSPTITAPALLTQGKISISANIIGCNPVQQERVTSVASYMTNGKFRDLAIGGNRLVLGAEMMRRLGVGLNQTVLVSVGNSAAVPFKVIGSFSTGNRGLDLQAYGLLSEVQVLNGTPNRVTEIGVRLKDYSQAGALAANWSKISPERVESWDQLFANVLSVFAIQTALRFAMILTVIVVASFGIYNILNMTVNQKRQDIAILRSMGYDSFDVVLLFFSQGLIVGVVGGAFGLVLGYWLCRYLQTIPFTGGPMGSPGGTLHISITASIYLQAAAMALFSSSIASILPARAAGRLTPIDVIRAGA